MVGDCPTIMEIDLVRSTYSVAHCGESAAGQFLNTLTCTDICTGWTEPIALRRRSQETVCFVIDAMQKGLPFDLLGIDSDNGSRLRYHNGSLQATIMALNSHLHLTQVQVSMTCSMRSTYSVGIVWTRRSPSHAPVHTRKMTRRMLNTCTCASAGRRTGPLYGAPLAMTAWKVTRSMNYAQHLLGWRASTE